MADLDCSIRHMLSARQLPYLSFVLSVTYSLRVSTNEIFEAYERACLNDIDCPAIGHHRKMLHISSLATTYVSALLAYKFFSRVVFDQPPPTRS